MSTKNELEAVLMTRVGRVTPDELHFRGNDVSTLLGSSYWGLVSRAIEGPEIDDSSRQVLDHLATCALACDPRLWPLKLVQLGASYGQLSSGLCVGLMAVERSALSYWCAGPAAAHLQRLATKSFGRPPVEVEKLVQQELPLGFGVYGRDGDRRVSLFREWRRATGVETGSVEQFVSQIEPWVICHHGQHLRFDGLVAAVLTDSGFSSEQVGILGGVVNALPLVLANAYEGSYRGTSLREVASAKVRYVGPQPRRSARSLGPRQV